MNRTALAYLRNWKNKPERKPLVIRGARQVGKSHLVRAFAQAEFRNLLELNFEQDPETATLFSQSDVEKTVQLLELQCKAQIIPGQTLIFLDEVQAAPQVFARLRFFYEQRPDLHLIAAGSLMDFMLHAPPVSMPVGRIEYMHLGPMNFEEFLQAVGEGQSLEFLSRYEPGEVIPPVLHRRYMDLVRQFCVVGGMPESVSIFAREKRLQACEPIKQAILATYQDDFSKYGKRVDYGQLRKVFRKVPLMVGEKLKYVNLDPEARSKELAQSVELLRLARVIAKVVHSSANGIPLGAEVNEKFFKVLFLDVGLLSSACGLSLLDYETADELTLVNKGAISEQFVGQHLLYKNPVYMEPELYYWAREKLHAAAEVDYVISHGHTIVPIEVKAGKTGQLRSLQLFLHEKKRRVGVRFNSDCPSVLSAHLSIPEQEPTPFTLLSLPFYLIGQTSRLLTGLLRQKPNP